MIIDLNADVSEGFGPFASFENPALYDLITSANIACGFHAGDAQLMSKTVSLCREKGVVIGAHPGYRDLIGFGRRSLAMTNFERETDLLYQIGALTAIARPYNKVPAYIKLHGAWYNDAMANKDHAKSLIEAVLRSTPTLKWLALAKSPFVETAAQMGVEVYQEAFCDRAYNDDGTLVNRKEPGAVIHDANQAIEHALRMVLDGKVKTINGQLKPIHVDSLCLHGDNPQALDFAYKLRLALENRGVKFASFSGE